jgi:mitofusin 2
VISQIPHSLPHRLSTKIEAQLAAIDYIHAHSTRISTAVRKVLRIPSDNLRVGLEQSVKQLHTRRDDAIKARSESNVALKYFSNLTRKSATQRNSIAAIDLDSPPPANAH